MATTPAPARSCGTCTLCCKLMAVSGFASVEDKPQGEWCRFCDKKGGGCAIYDARPQACRDFVCGWLGGIGTEPMKPSRSKVVLAARPPMPDGRRVLLAHVDPNNPEAFRQGAMGQFIQHAVSKGVVVVVIKGTSRLLLCNDPSLIQQVARHVEEHGGSFG